MYSLFRATLTCALLLATVVLLTTTAVVEGKTAVLFGATGAVGNEVLLSIVRNPFFTKVVIVGRRFPPKVTDLLPQSSLQIPEVVKIQLSDLEDVDKNKELLAMKADACFIAVASGFPHLSDLHDWYSVEVKMAASMTRLCSQMHVRSVTVFSAIDTDENPEPFSKEQLKKDNSDDAAPLGLWNMIKYSVRMMGLKENAVMTNSKSVPFVRIFQPSNIITKEIRYGWLDWTIFKIHPFLDIFIPTRYHSVNVTLLGAAMVGDAVRILSSSSPTRDKDGPTRLMYGDYSDLDYWRTAEKNFKKDEKEQNNISGDKNMEL